MDLTTIKIVCKDCNTPLKFGRLCDRCKKRRCKYQKDRRIKLKEAGLCCVCGKEPPEKPSNRCIKCIENARNRFKEKPTCTKCGRSRTEYAFTPYKNICHDCHNKQTRSNAAQKPKGYWTEYRKIAASKSYDSFLRRLLYMTKNRGRCRHQSLIDFTYLHDLLIKQDYKCAVTHIHMTHERHSLFAISIDRIDSTVGYIPGNVQLVCKAVNLAKNTHSQNEIIEFFRAVKMA